MGEARGIRNRATIAALGVALLACFVYGPALSNGFALDDRTDLAENRFVTGPLDLWGIFSSEYYGGWGYLATGHYRPLLNLTYKLVAAAFGMNPVAFHALNVLVFAALAALSVLLVGRLTGDLRIGALAGAIFAVHPVNSESVASIVGLKELASVGLGMLALHLYIRGRERERERFEPGSAGPEAVAPPFLAILAGCLYKETALAFVPIAIAAELLHHRAPRPGDLRGLLRRAARVWPLAAGALAALALRALVTGGLFRPTVVYSVDNPLVLVTEPFRRVAALAVLPRYLELWLWPACLSADYSEGSFPVARTPADPWILGALAIVAASFAVLILAWRRGARAVAFGLLAFGSSYALVSNVVVLIGTAMAERLFLLPSWGLAVAAAGALVAIADRWAAHKTRRAATATLAIALLLPAGARTWHRAADWASNDTLAASVLECHPDNMKVLIVRADAEARAGRHERARELYERALAIRADAPYAMAAMGAYLLDRGEEDRAVALLERSALSPEPVPGAVVRLALHLVDRGRDDEALRYASRALEARPSFADAAMARIVRGGVLLNRGRVDDAEAEFRAAIGDDPDQPAAWFNLARCLEARGRVDDAVAALDKAESLAPGDVRASLAIAVVLARLGRLDRSLATIERVRKLAPDLAEEAERRLAAPSSGGP